MQSDAAGGLTPSSTMDPEATTSLIGPRIRELRHARELTLNQVAAASGLSQPFLSQVETGRARPSFASLDKIARALGTTQVELFATLAGAGGSFEPSPDRADGQALESAGPFEEGSVRVLAARAKSFTPVEFTADNLGYGSYFVHDEEEFVYVIAGSVHVDLATQSFTRSAGESFFYPARTPHRWRSLDGSPYRVLVVKEKLAAESDVS